MGFCSGESEADTVNGKPVSVDDPNRDFLLAAESSQDLVNDVTSRHSDKSIQASLKLHSAQPMTLCVALWEWCQDMLSHAMRTVSGPSSGQLVDN